MQWNLREIALAEDLACRIRLMNAQGYSLTEIFANITPFESRFLNPNSLLQWKQIRAQTKKSGQIFTLRNNPKEIGLSVGAE